MLLSLCLVGCSFLTSHDASISDPDLDNVDPDLDNFRIVTDQAVYQPDSESLIKIEYTLINNTGQTLYITNESESLLGSMYKKVGDDEWVFAFGFTLPDKLGFPLQLATGESYTQRIWLATPGDAWRIADEDVEGTFRIQEQIFSRWDQETVTGDLLPEEKLLSNTFEIKR